MHMFQGGFSAQQQQGSESCGEQGHSAILVAQNWILTLCKIWLLCPQMPETPFLQAPHMYTFGPVIASFGNSSEKGVTEAREPSTAQGQVGNEVEDPYAVGWCLPLLGGFLWTSLEPWTCASLEGSESAATHTRVTLDLGPGQAFSPW